MLNTGKALKVSIYTSEGAKHHGAPVYTSILDYLFYRGVSGATALRGVAGFGADHHMHTASINEIADFMPIKIEFVETEEKVNELLGKLEEMVGSGLIEVQETTIAKPAETSKARKSAHAEHVKIQGKAKLMRIYISEADKWKGKPLHLALVEAMRANDIAGVTVYRGILGYGAHGHLHKDRALHLSHNCSLMLSVIDAEEKLAAFYPILDQMIMEGLVVLSDVDIIKYSHRAAEAAVAQAQSGSETKPA